jgi:hypothetical protein
MTTLFTGSAGPLVVQRLTPAEAGSVDTARRTTAMTKDRVVVCEVFMGSSFRSLFVLVFRPLAAAGQDGFRQGIGKETPSRLPRRPLTEVLRDPEASFVRAGFSLSAGSRRLGIP